LQPVLASASVVARPSRWNKCRAAFSNGGSMDGGLAINFKRHSTSGAPYPPRWGGEGNREAGSHPSGCGGLTSPARLAVSEARPALPWLVQAGSPAGARVWHPVHVKCTTVWRSSVAQAIKQIALAGHGRAGVTRPRSEARHLALMRRRTRYQVAHDSGSPALCHPVEAADGI
jgi:hypothetical protein